jgi:hypothetical protein
MSFGGLKRVAKNLVSGEWTGDQKFVFGREGQGAMKKIWQKPTLIILLKGRPEELVLTNCKGSDIRAGRLNQNNGCRRLFCFALCNALAPS